MNRSARAKDGSILDRIVATKREEVSGLAARRTEWRREAEAAEPARPFGAVLARRGEVALIAEYKRRSPSAGALGSGDPAEVGRQYETGGAAALSVLTDATYFGGSVADLVAAKAAVGLPVLRKDFVLDDVQVWEGRARGADAILLIVRILGDDVLRGLIELSSELGMAALVEVHDAGELDRALKSGASLIGVNNRDLSTFRTDLSVSESLIERIPPDRIAVSESGIDGPAAVDRVGQCGYDAVLVGEALMRSGADVGSFIGRVKRDRNESRALWRSSTC
ncbi:MAG: indole-3-glycerol phosphate synthase TrpC [Longimicrobiales bacterium]